MSIGQKILQVEGYIEAHRDGDDETLPFSVCTSRPRMRFLLEMLNFGFRSTWATRQPRRHPPAARNRRRRLHPASTPSMMRFWLADMDLQKISELYTFLQKQQCQCAKRKERLRLRERRDTDLSNGTGPSFKLLQTAENGCSKKSTILKNFQKTFILRIFIAKSNENPQQRIILILGVWGGKRQHLENIVFFKTIVLSHLKEFEARTGTVG